MHPHGGVSLADEESPLLGGPTTLKGNTVYIYLVAGLSAVGGFLFGYDTGIISGAMIFVRDVFQLDVWWQEAIVSSTLLTAWMFSILASSGNDKFGRKPVILMASLIFVIGSVVMAVAWNKIVLLTGRFIVGAGVGFASMTTPMYIAEVAPPAIRGQLVMINMCFITGGQFMSSIVAYGFSFLDDGHEWRYMLGLAALPAAIQFFAFMLMPESPRWLINSKRYDEAKSALRKMRPKRYDIELEFEAIRRRCLESKREEEEQAKQSTFSRIIANQPVRKALFVGCLLQLVQQVSGINTVMYYTASIFEMAGVYSKQKALLFTIGTAFVNFVFTIVGLIFVERMGRRRLVLLSLFGVVVGLLILALGFQVAYFNSPKVKILPSNYPGDDQMNLWPANGACGSYADCSSCTQDPQCGFCFTPSSSITTQNQSVQQQATCLRVDLQDHERSVLGNCSQGSTNQHVWAYEWCPSSYAWLTMLGMVVYLATFAPGIGPMAWIINSEIYPSWARSWCLSAATSTNWLFNLLVSMTFLSLTRAITKQGAFYLYASCASAGFLYFLFVLPETRGKTLEELEQLFASKHWLERQCKRRSQSKQ